MVWTCGTDGGRKTTNRCFIWKRGGKDKQREAKDGQCQGRPESEKHRLDQDWRSDQKQRGLMESSKCLIVSSLTEGRKE